MTTVAGAAAAFLIGSLPTGYLLTRLRQGEDVRRTGSGGIGATNVLRVAGAGTAAATLVFDAAKGAAAVSVSEALTGGGADAAAWGAVAAVCGNAFCPWLGFRGGKGVATGAGALAMVSPAALGVALAAFVAVLAATRYVSAASVVAAVAFPSAAAVLRSGAPAVAAGAAVATVVLARHAGNWGRWRRGEEPRLGRRIDRPAGGS